MRTIKFRGKVTKTKQWVYGDLLHVGNGCIITTNSELGETLPDGDIGLAYSLDEFAVVIPETAGQFTGLLDKNGKYEGDILQEIGSDKTVLVVYEAPQFCYADNSFGYKFLNHPENYTVIGNIHDNPELLKGGNNEN